MATAPRTALLVLSLFCLAISVLSVSGRPARQSGATDLIVHEWGTFTSVAGRNGQAVRWRPLDGSTDLPNFVEHLRGAELKPGLQGTVRMETPVLYFYSSMQTTVSASVSFARGLITEWYPHADRIKPDPDKLLLPTSLFDHNFRCNIAWNAVTISPGLAANLPHDEIETHYYAARETASSPLIVNTPTGAQQEKFLFYRGVSVTPVPVAAQSAEDGKLFVKNLGQDTIPQLILFERRGDKMGYRLGGALQTDATLDPPELTSTMESLGRDLEGILTTQGLYPDEARAMIATWQSSWFEEGSRVALHRASRFREQYSAVVHPSRAVTGCSGLRWQAGVDHAGDRTRRRKRTGQPRPPSDHEIRPFPATDPGRNQAREPKPCRGDLIGNLWKPTTCSWLNRRRNSASGRFCAKKSRRGRPKIARQFTGGSRSPNIRPRALGTAEPFRRPSGTRFFLGLAYPALKRRTIVNCP